jgi:hypothetical protein
MWAGFLLVGFLCTSRLREVLMLRDPFFITIQTDISKDLAETSNFFASATPLGVALKPHSLQLYISTN